MQKTQGCSANWQTLQATKTTNTTHRRAKGPKGCTLHHQSAQGCSANSASNAPKALHQPLLGKYRKRLSLSSLSLFGLDLIARKLFWLMAFANACSDLGPVALIMMMTMMVMTLGPWGLDARKRASAPPTAAAKSLSVSRRHPCDKRTLITYHPTAQTQQTPWARGRASWFVPCALCLVTRGSDSEV